ESAELLVTSPFRPAEGVLAVERHGVVRVQRFRLDEASGTVRFPVEAGWVPGVKARVVLAGAADRRPAYAVGSVRLEVAPTDRRLHVSVEPKETKRAPGAATAVDVAVRDARGAPVPGALAAVMVVDEAVLALTGYRTPDPMAVFYAPEPGNGAYAIGLREDVL